MNVIIYTIKEQKKIKSVLTKYINEDKRNDVMGRQRIVNEEDIKEIRKLLLM